MDIQKNIPVSIIVPIYNVEKYIHKCLDSIINQTFKSFECILVDDCSPDNSPAICDEYAKIDSRFKAIHKEKNEGLPLARKTGLDAAQGDYILNIDSDDWIESDMVEKLYYLNDKVEGGYDIVYCDFCDDHIFNNHEKLLRDKNFENGDNILRIKEWLGGNFSSSCVNKLVKKNIYQKIIFPQYFYDEDCVICIQLLYFAKKIGYINKPFYHVISSESSMTRDKKRSLRNNKEQSINMCNIYSFLNEKFGKNINYFEPELSKRINKFRRNCLQIKELRKEKLEIYKIYPQSKKNIFLSSLELPLYEKIVLYLATKKIKWPYGVYDTLRHLKRRIKSIHKK